MHAALSLIRGRQLIAPDYPLRPRPRYGYGLPSHRLLCRMISSNTAAYRRRLQELSRLRPYLHNIPPAMWHNDWLPPLDGATLYMFIKQLRPRRYFEVGSGASTRFARRAIDDHQLPTVITSIDPSPRMDIDKLCDRAMRRPLEQCHPATFTQLDKNDILFIDNSHQAFQNSDVTVFFLEILPALKPGVVVGIHDITLPDDYPPSYARHYYSEQYLLACWLLGGGRGIETVLPNWFCSQDPELASLAKPLFSHPAFKGIDTHGSIFWIRKV